MIKQKLTIFASSRSLISIPFSPQQGDCLNAIGKHFHPECFNCSYCGKLFGNSPFFLEDGRPYCEADWNELFTTKCFACGFPVEAGDRWVEALSHNYHSQCFNCTVSVDKYIEYCKIEIQTKEIISFYKRRCAKRTWRDKVSTQRLADHIVKTMLAKATGTSSINLNNLTVKTA